MTTALRWPRLILRTPLRLLHSSPMANKVRRVRYKEPVVDPVSAEGVLTTDVQAMLKVHGIDSRDAVTDMQRFFATQQEKAERPNIEVEIRALSSVGDGLAFVEIEDVQENGKSVDEDEAETGKTVDTVADTVADQTITDENSEKPFGKTENSGKPFGKTENSEKPSDEADENSGKPSDKTEKPSDKTEKTENPSNKTEKPSEKTEKPSEKTEKPVSSKKRKLPVSHQRYQVYVVPHALPGEKVLIKPYRTFKHYTQSQVIEVIEASRDRDESLVKCRYFSKCSGCQYQMVPYERQLEIKRSVIVNAFAHYAKDIADKVPEIQDTVGSPLQYKYRTKLTPHFDILRPVKIETPPPIGFGQRGRKTVLDIEECSIGTDIVNEGMTRERKTVQETFMKFKRGATLLLRENVVEDPETKTKSIVCSTSTKDLITEYVGAFKFQYPAGSFFQNNNSILPLVTDYVRENIVLPSTGKAPRYLVDTYCGSGLFAITCSPAVEQVLGVEISKDSVTYAEKNAAANKVQNAEFLVGDAEKIFAKVDTPPDETSIVIDPPRKGCDEPFLNQLLDFGPAKVVYVSCNVHSQARDVQYLLTSEKGKHYGIESIRGFDFFPQTHHVESVVVLTKAPN